MTNVRKLTPRQEDRRQRILKAAREMVANHGYEGMVMSQVAEQAGVSPTTLYNLYNTKDQLVLESLRELLVDHTQRVAGTSDGPGWKFLLEMIRDGAYMANTAPAYAEAITQAMLRAGAGDPLIEILLSSTQRDMQKSLNAMQADGSLDERINVQQMATSLHGLYWSSFMLWNKGLVQLQDIEHTLQVNFLGMLIPASLGEARREMEVLYEGLLNEI